MPNWSLTYKTKADFYANNPQVSVGTPSPDQLQYARKSAMNVFESGSFGTNCDFAIYLNGCNDTDQNCLTVSVYQLS